VERTFGGMPHDGMRVLGVTLGSGRFAEWLSAAPGAIAAFARDGAALVRPASV